MIGKVFSELSGDYRNFFKMASRLEYTASASDELGKFIVAYFLDRVQHDRFPEKGKTEEFRSMLREEIKSLRMLSVGVRRWYSEYFGEADNTPDFYYLNYAVSCMASPESRKDSGKDVKGKYDFIIVSNSDVWPHMRSLEKLLKARLGEKYDFGKDVGLSESEFDNFLYDYKHYLFNYMMTFARCNEIKELEIDAGKNDALAKDGDIRKAEKIKIWNALGKIGREDYELHVINNHLADGGILMDLDSSYQDYDGVKKLDEEEYFLQIDKFGYKTRKIKKTFKKCAGNNSLNKEVNKI